VNCSEPIRKKHALVPDELLTKATPVMEPVKDAGLKLVAKTVPTTDSLRELRIRKEGWLEVEEHKRN
jgi:hypothetical protein